MVQCVDKLEREMLELVRGKPSEVCVCVCVCVCVYVCVLDLAGPVSVHALEPVSYTAALSVASAWNSPT